MLETGEFWRLYSHSSGEAVIFKGKGVISSATGTTVIITVMIL